MAKTTIVAAAIGILTTATVFYLGQFTPAFSSDSWSYYELSDTVFSDFFRVTTVRQYSEPTEYSNSFPPFWPVAIAVARRGGLDCGIYTGYVLNAAANVLLLLVLIRLLKRLDAPGWCGALIFLGLLCFRPYVAEDAMAGLSIAWSLVFFLAGLTLVARGPVSPGAAAAAGVCLGLACLTRFEFAPAALFLAVVLARRRLRSAVLFSAAVALMLSPWMAYNFQHFGKPFASDNSRQVLAAQPNSVLDYYDGPPPTLTSDPAAWVKGFLAKKCTRSARGILEAVRVSVLPVALLLTLLLTRPPVVAGNHRGFDRLCGLLALLLVVPVLLVGYGMIERYYTVHLILLLLILVPRLYARLPGPVDAPWRVAAILLVPALLAVAQASPPFLSKPVGLLNPGTYREATAPTSLMQTLATQVRTDAAGRPHRILLTDDLFAAKFGALTHTPAAMKPLLNGPLRKLVQDWGITHLYDPNKWFGTVPHDGVELVPLAEPGLFRVRLAAAP